MRTINKLLPVMLLARLQGKQLLLGTKSLHVIRQSRWDFHTKTQSCGTKPRTFRGITRPEFERARERNEQLWRPEPAGDASGYLSSDYGVGGYQATGGPIAGSDTVPALLTPGEFVINRDSASRIGLANLSSMNRGEVKGYAGRRFGHGCHDGCSYGWWCLIGGSKRERLLVRGVMGGALAMSACLATKRARSRKGFCVHRWCSILCCGRFNQRADNELELK